MVFKTLLLFPLLTIIVVAQQYAQENRIQQSAGGQTTFFQQQYPSNSQTSGGSCCRTQQQPQQPQPQPQSQPRCQPSCLPQSQPQPQQSSKCCQPQQPSQSQPQPSNNRCQTSCQPQPQPQPYPQPQQQREKCCRPQQQPQPQPQQANRCCQPMQPQQAPAPIQTRTQTTKTWQISGYSTRQQSPQSLHAQPQTNNHNVEYRNVEGQGGGESLRIDYNSGRCVVTLDTVTENGVPRGHDAHSKAKFRAYADQLNSWQHQLRGQLGRDGDQQQQGPHWNNEPRVPDCPCAAQFCGQVTTQNYAQNQQSNWPQPASLSLQNQQQQQAQTTHSYEFQFNNGRCVLKDGQVTEDGRPRGLNAHERAKLDEFKRQFDQYSQRLHNEMKQKFNSYLTRDNNQQQQQGSGSLVIREFTPSSPPEPPCLCSEAACGRQ